MSDDFKAGDPCGNCGSTKTFWDMGDGWSCGSCLMTDAT